MSKDDSSAGTARLDVLARRRRNALLLGVAGLVSAAVTTLISLVLGYDRLAEGTVGGTVTTMLFVAALLLVTSGVILGVRVRTPPHGITPWRRVGKAALIVWLGVAALWGVGILIGRAFPVTGPGVELIVVLLSLLALPLVLWLPVWTLLSAVRSPGRVEPGVASPMEEGVESSALAPVGAVADEADDYGTKAPLPVANRATRPTGLLAALGTSLLVIVVLGLVVAFLLGRQSVPEPSVAPSSNASSEPSAKSSDASNTPDEQSSTPSLLSPKEAEGLAWAVAGCLGHPDAVQVYFGGFTWEPIYNDVATRLGVPDIDVPREGLWKSYNFRFRAFELAAMAEPDSVVLRDLWLEAGAYAYQLSEQVALAREPRSYALQGVADQYGTRLESGCEPVLQGAREEAGAAGMELPAWIERHAPGVRDAGPAGWG